MKSQPCQHNQDQMKTNMNPSITMTNMSNNQQNFNSIPPYFTVNNNTKNMINEPVMFKNYSNNLLNGNTPINQNNPVNLNQMNPFIAGNNNNLLMPQNLTMGQNSMNSLGNFVQIPVMIANRPSPQIQQIPQQFPMPMPMQGNWAVVDSFGNFNEQMGINNMAPNDAGILSNQNSNMQKIFDNNIFIQQGNHNNNNPMNNPNNQNVENNQNYQMNNIMSSYMSSFQEFETRMFDIIKNQNRTLQLIKDDNDKTHETLNKIKQELTQLKYI